MATPTSITNPTPSSISALLSKLSDPDPDFRFMSLNDLIQILTKYKTDFLLHDYNISSRMVDAVIKALDDQNGEVQNLALKCIGPMIQRIASAVVAPTLEKITTIEVANSPDNSLAAAALRNAISALPRPVLGRAYSKEVLEAYHIISRVVTPRILRVSTEATSTKSAAPAPSEAKTLFGAEDELTLEAIDILIEILRCFGPLLQPVEVERLHGVVMHVLKRKTTSSPVKKRAVVALSMLGPYLSEDVLGEFVVKISTALGEATISSVMRRLYITILSSLARSVPHRFGVYLPRVLPFVFQTLSEDELQMHVDAISEGNDQAMVEFNDVREVALVALEAFLASCGPQMRSSTDLIISSCLRYVKYDPNYAVDEENDEMDDENDDSEDEDDEFEDDVGFDDDDDTSWKVRRCAAKTLYTLVSTRSTDLIDKGILYSNLAGPLLKRFSEREEGVRLEVIAIVALIIRKTGEGVVRECDAEDQELLQCLPESRKRRRGSSAGALALPAKAPYKTPTGLSSPLQEEVPPTGPRADLLAITSELVKQTTKLLSGKQVPTKQATVDLLDNLIVVQNGGLSDYLDQVMPPLIGIINGSTGNVASNSITASGGAASATPVTLRVATLALTGGIAKTHSSSLLQPYLSNLVDGVIHAVKDRYYKISSGAIKTAEELVKAITPPRARLTCQKYEPELLKLYEIIAEQAATNDADVEVRKNAIQALGSLLSRTSGSDGPVLLAGDKRQVGLDLLLDRLRNETTRLSAVRAINAVTRQAVSLDAGWIQPVALELCGQLRKANRALRGASVMALQHLTTSPAAKGSLAAQTIEGIVKAIMPVIVANDSHLLGPALLVLAHLQLENPKLILTPGLVEALCELLKKSMTGLSLDSLVSLAINVGQCGLGERLMKGVLAVGIAGDVAAVGMMAGALLVASNGYAGVTIDSFVHELKQASGQKTPDLPRQCLALTILGEIGMRLGTKSPIKPDLFLEQFHDEPDRASITAAVSMGRAGSGNVHVFLPVILEAIKQPGSQQYLLLQSIREILHQVVVSSIDISQYQEKVWELLFEASRSEDNKAISAECIGRLAIIEPNTYIPMLQALFSDPDRLARAVAVQAIRYTMPDSEESFDAVLKPALFNMLLTALQDDDKEIRRLAMTTLNSAAHNKPLLVLPHLGDLVPFVMKESIIKPELIREVQMGPFKHMVDDGLEVRKSAYETLYALMETAFSRIDSLEFYDRIIAGLSDEADIRALCNLMIGKLIVNEPVEITRRLDRIAESYRAILSTKVKEGSVKQEVERQTEANKSVLRVTLLLADKTKTTLPAANVATEHQIPQQAQLSPAVHAVWQTYWEWVNEKFNREIKLLREDSVDDDR